jgi:hypothetical protein
MQTCCGSFGGTYDPLQAGATPLPSSTGSSGRHGSQNLWNRWPKTGSKSKGIAARAPYDQGPIVLPPSVGGGTKNNPGMSLGTHGHGVGVVKAAIGGAHNKATHASIVKNIGGNRTLVSAPTFCPKCFITWAVAGAVVLLLIIIGGK